MERLKIVLDIDPSDVYILLYKKRLVPDDASELNTKTPKPLEELLESVSGKNLIN